MKNVEILKSSVWILVLLEAFVLLFSPAPSFAIDNSAKLQVGVAKYEPYPASPGRYVEIWLKVENDGYRDAKNVTVVVENSFPFLKLEGQHYIWVVGQLQPSQSVIKKFRFVVDRNAVSGTNYLRVRFSSDASSGVWITKELGVDVKEYQALIRIASVSFDKTPAPGSKVNMTLSVENDAEVYLKNIVIVMGEPGSDLFKYAIEGSNTRAIDMLNPGERKNVSFILLIDGSSKAGVYSLPLTLEYHDESGVTYTRTEYIGMALNRKPELKVYVESPEDYFQKGSLNKLRITIVNEGTSDAKFVNIALKNGEGYEIVGKRSEYLGEIESDDQASITTQIYIREDSSSILKIPIALSFRDVLNNKYDEMIVKEVRVFSGEELERYGIHRSKAKLYLYILLVGVAIYLIKNRNKALRIFIRSSK